MEPEEKIIPVNQEVTHETTCEHYYLPDESDPNSELLSAECQKCWSGISYNPKTHQLKNGKLEVL